MKQLNQTIKVRTKPFYLKEISEEVKTILQASGIRAACSLFFVNTPVVVLSSWKMPILLHAAILNSLSVA